jgi:hypothetical protein
MSLTTKQKGDFIQIIGRHLPLDHDDDSLFVLKAQLICEELVNDYIANFTAYPEYILGPDIRSYLPEKIRVAQAISNEDVHDKWVWKGLKNLSQLRNAYAHSLVPEPERLSKAESTFTNYVKSNQYYEFKNHQLSEFRNAIMSLLMAVFVVVEISKNAKAL